MKTTLVKIGGNELDDPQFVRQAATAIHAISQHDHCVVVHGGGAVISRMLERLGIEPKFSPSGQRVTDVPTMEVVEFILCGQVNKMLVTALLDTGVDAMGISGIDRRLMWAEQLSEEIERLGRVANVRPEVITDLFAQGIVPVVAPPSNGPDGRYNINADSAAGAIGGALQADRVIFVTDVPGVKANGSIIPELVPVEVEALKADGTIYGGMIPKTEAALSALQQGARSAVITNVDGLAAGTGTVLINEEKH